MLRRVVGDGMGTYGKVEGSGQNVGVRVCKSRLEGRYGLIDYSFVKRI